MKKIFLLFPLLLAGCGSEEDKSAPYLSREAGDKLIVGYNETVYSLAYKYGFSTQALIRANNLQPPYTLTPGQSLMKPGSENMASASGPTDFEIVPYKEPAAEPSIESGATPANAVPMAEAPSAGQHVSLKPLAPLAGAAVTSREEEKPVSPPKGPFVPPADTLKAQEKKPVPNELSREIALEKTPKKETAPEEPKIKEEKTASADKSSTKPDQKAGKRSFSWPLQGDIIKKFGSGKNEGVDIAGSLGDNVEAADSGDVVYAGSDLQDLGNLVLIKHKDGWMTAYAHNSKLLVKKGDAVAKGQKIAEVGQSGNASQPKLHFEIRNPQKRTVDPLLHLGS